MAKKISELVEYTGVTKNSTGSIPISVNNETKKN